MARATATGAVLPNIVIGIIMAPIAVVWAGQSEIVLPLLLAWGAHAVWCRMRTWWRR
jgi:hypothetical protein